MEGLERFLTEYYEGQSCTLFARGSTGLYTLFKALSRIKGIGEIIIPGICCETVAMAAVYAGMKPVIADVDRDNLCLCYESVLKKLSDKTVAVILVYIFGNLFDTRPFEKLKDTYDVVIVEDLAQAVGGHDSVRKPGSKFDFTLLSFADEKIVRGKGGAIIQRNSSLGDLLHMTSTSLPLSPEQRILEQKQLSLRNLTHALYDLYRADPSINISQTFQAMLPHYENLIVRQGQVSHSASIISQFQEIMNEQQKRYEKYEFYKHHIHNGVVKLIEMTPGTMCWRVPLLVEKPAYTFYLTDLLRKNKIPASNHYFPLDKLLYNFENRNTSYIGPRIINLWVDDSVTWEKIHKSVQLINSYDPAASQKR